MDMRLPLELYVFLRIQKGKCHFEIVPNILRCVQYGSSTQGRSQGGARGGDRPPNRQKTHSLKKAKSVEKWGGGGGTRYIPEAETD